MGSFNSSTSARSLPANTFPPTVSNLADQPIELPLPYQAHVYKNEPELTLGTIFLGVVLVVLLASLIYVVQRPSPLMAGSPAITSPAAGPAP